VTIDLGIPEEELPQFRAWLADATAGSATAVATGTAYVDV
jgi:hypothetical protein